jgi:hypothetical protein
MEAIVRPDALPNGGSLQHIGCSRRNRIERLDRAGGSDEHGT